MIANHRHSGGSVRQSCVGHLVRNFHFPNRALGQGESGANLRFRDGCALRRRRRDLA